MNTGSAAADLSGKFEQLIWRVTLNLNFASSKPTRNETQHAPANSKTLIFRYFNKIVLMTHDLC